MKRSALLSIGSGADGMAATLHIANLPASATQAAKAYYAAWADKVEQAVLEAGGCLTLRFDPAARDHQAWRRAAVADLARGHAPIRINAVAGPQGPAFDQVVVWLENAPGITGQLLAVDSQRSKIAA